MNELQKLIAQAVESMGEKQNFTEAMLAKKIRELTGFDGKKHAGIPLADLEEALSSVCVEKGEQFAIHVNQANVILIERKSCSGTDGSCGGEVGCGDMSVASEAGAVEVTDTVEGTDAAETVAPESRKRRLASEKSQVLFTNGDFANRSSFKNADAKNSRAQKKAQAKAHHQQRGERRSININSNFEDMEDF